MPLRKMVEMLGIAECDAGAKFIPDIYKQAAINDRLDLIAGLLDTDGSLTHGCFDFISKSKVLAHDLAFVCRSVGLAAYVRHCRKGCQTGAIGDYYRVCISGNTEIIPCKITRKAATQRLQKKDALVSAFRVESEGPGLFYGWQLSGNGRYLLDDFTITHNSGKSIVGMVSGYMTGTTSYLVHSRMLQTQLGNDFTEAPVLWGRGNYECLKSRNEIGDVINCDACTHSKGRPCRVKRECLYEVAKNRAAKSRLRILNYDYFITEANYVGKFANNDLVVVDEADSLEDTLVGHIQIEMSNKMIDKLKLPKPEFKTAGAKDGVESWKRWAKMAQEQVNKMRVGLSNVIENMGEIRAEWQVAVIKQEQRARSMANKLGVFLRHVDEGWIYEERTHTAYGSSGVVFRPVWLTTAIADEFIWRHGTRFVLMSATFHRPQILAKLLGIPLEDMEFHEFPSPFPVEHREIALNPVANLTYKTMDEEVPKLIKGIKEVLAKHPNEKGLIHCVSYGLANKIMEIGDPRLVTHNGGDKIDTIDMFKSSPDPLVLVSPSSERGLSLDDDYCRFIIWAKAPFLNLKDKLVQSRLYAGGKVGQQWYASHMLLTVVQGCGRGTRSKTDRCLSYILDKQIANGFTKNGRMLPGWFREAVW